MTAGRRQAGKEIRWIKICMQCLKDTNEVVSFNTARGSITYAEHMEEHELTGKADK